jgi:hypothetical protein
MRRNTRATTVSLNLPETLELRAAHIAAASPTSAPLLASLPIDPPEAIPADQCEAITLAADLCGLEDASGCQFGAG